MPSSLSALPPNISDLNIHEVVRDAKDYALIHGLCLRPKDETANDILEVAPLTLFPSPFPRDAFYLAKEVQTSMNLLMHNISRDLSFIQESLKETIKVDDFTKNLLKVYEDVERIGASQPLQFGLFRTDYMLNEGDGRLLQVESNAISSGFANLGPKTTRLHQYLIKRYFPRDVSYNLPENKADINFPSAFIRAWESYGNPNAVILYVVEDRTVNLCDQRGHDFTVADARPDIQIIRRSFTQLHECASVDNDRRLLIDKKIEVALVYYRHCYDPSHYTRGTASWGLRLKIELSRAIKCPSIGYHLSGVKKFQEILTKEEIVKKFLPDKEAHLLHSTFAGFWSLGDQDVINMAITEPDKFVLKPQREGGGHNIYGRDIATVLPPIRDSPEKLKYILMQLIRAPVIDNILMGPNVHPSIGHIDQVTCELGIFGSILGSKNIVSFNNEDGHVLRCKRLGINEGGICCGYGAIDSPLLI